MNVTTEMKKNLKSQNDIIQNAFNSYSTILDKAYEDRDKEFDDKVAALEDSYKQKKENLLSQLDNERKELDKIKQMRAAAQEAILREKQIKDWHRKWGMDYDEQQLEYLENLHQGLLNSQNVVGALNEDQALKLCKISLIIEEKIRAGLDFSKELKSYDSLATLSNLTPKNVKDANEFDSFGEVYAYLEKTGWVNKYYDGAIRDEVDNTEKNIKNWIRYLYVNGIEFGHSYGNSGHWEEFNTLFFPIKAGNVIRHTGDNSTCFLYQNVY